jgi:hypothetical protein
MGARVAFLRLLRDELVRPEAMPHESVYSSLPRSFGYRVLHTNLVERSHQVNAHGELYGHIRESSSHIFAVIKSEVLQLNLVFRHSYNIPLDCLKLSSEMISSICFHFESVEK